MNISGDAQTCCRRVRGRHHPLAPALRRARNCSRSSFTPRTGATLRGRRKAITPPRPARRTSSAGMSIAAGIARRTSSPPRVSASISTARTSSAACSTTLTRTRPSPRPTGLRAQSGPERSRSDCRKFLLWCCKSGHCPIAELRGSSCRLPTRPRRFALISGDASLGSSARVVASVFHFPLRLKITDVPAAHKAPSRSGPARPQSTHRPTAPANAARPPEQRAYRSRRACPSAIDRQDGAEDFLAHA